MALQGAEIVHLRAAGEIQGQLLRIRAALHQACLGAHARVVAAECDGVQAGVRVSVAGRLLVGDHPRAQAKLVDAHVVHGGTRRGTHLEHRAHQRHHVVVRHEALDHRDLALALGVDHQARERDDAVGLDVVRHRDDRVRVHTLRHDQRRLDTVGKVHLCEHVGRGLHRDARARGGHKESLRAADLGAHGARCETRQVEFADAAVPPDLFFGARQGESGIHGGSSLTSSCARTGASCCVLCSLRRARGPRRS